MTTPYSSGDAPNWDDDHHGMTRDQYWALVVQRRAQLTVDHDAGVIDYDLYKHLSREASHYSPTTLREDVGQWTPPAPPGQSTPTTADEYVPELYQVAQRAGHLWHTGYYTRYTEAHQAAYDQLVDDALRRAGQLPERRRIPHGEYRARQRAELAQQREEMEDRVLARASSLDPNDTSPEAAHTWEVAASIRDHREMAARRQGAAAALQYDQTGDGFVFGLAPGSHDRADYDQDAVSAAAGHHADRCGAAHPEDPSPCDGPAANAAAGAANDRGGHDFDQSTEPAADVVEQTPRLTQQEAVEITTRHRDAGAEPHTRRYAQHLLDRYDTIRGIETMHGVGAENPDLVAEVVEEMRRLAAGTPPAQRQQEADRGALERAATTSNAQLRAQTALDRLGPGRRPFAVDAFDPAHTHGPGHAAAEVDDGQLAR